MRSQYGVTVHGIQYLIWLIDKHRFNVLRKVKNKYYSIQEKERIINRVLLNNESINSVAIDEGLASRGMLRNWIKKYKDMGYNIVERKRDRSTVSKVTKKMKQIKKKLKGLSPVNYRLQSSN